MKFIRKSGTWAAAALFGTALTLVPGGSLLAQKNDASKSSASADTNATKTSAADTKFAKEAAAGGMMEVELGKIAVQKASNEKVKTFGQRMIDDHSKAAAELKSIAAKENITLPSELDAKHKAMVDKYSGMSGAAFDRAYMADMVKDHQADVADFQKEASNGSNYDLKNWAGITLPTLQDHLRMAKETQSALGITSSKK